MADGYSFKGYNKENMARAIGRSLPISFKQGIEICNLIRGKNVSFAKDFLNGVIKKKNVVPFKRFNHHMGHKTGVGPGRYPKKASKEILDLINAVEANAQFKGLSTSNLIIKHISTNKGITTMRFGRKRSRKAKRSQVEVVVQEKAEKKNKKEKTEQVKVKENKKEENRTKATNKPVENKSVRKTDQDKPKDTKKTITNKND